MLADVFGVGIVFSRCLGIVLGASSKHRQTHKDRHRRIVAESSVCGHVCSFVSVHYCFFSWLCSDLVGFVLGVVSSDAIGLVCGLVLYQILGVVFVDGGIVLWLI